VQIIGKVIRRGGGRMTEWPYDIGAGAVHGPVESGGSTWGGLGKTNESEGRLKEKRRGKGKTKGFRV